MEPLTQPEDTTVESLHPHELERWLALLALPIPELDAALEELFMEGAR